VKRTNILAALACALLVLGLAGCGATKGLTNHLESIQLGAKLVNGKPPSGQSGFFSLVGNGGTIQLQAIGTYSSGKTRDLTGSVAYKMVVDPVNNVDAFGFLLLPPCAGPPCPVPSGPPFTNGTAEIDVNGLVTATDPATCTWIDVAPLDKNGNPQTPAWFYTGAYVVTVSFEGINSPPMYIPVASSGGNQFYNGQENNPSGACGPS
jgi:hypothetical protein